MKSHEMKCNNCGQIIDLRNLSQVFAHEDCNGIPVDYSKIEDIQYSGAKQFDEPIFYPKNKDQSICLS